MKKRTWTLMAVGAMALISLVLIWVYFKGRPGASTKELVTLTSNQKQAAKVVQVVKPRLRESTTINASHLCVLHPFYRAELNSRLTGTVKKVTKNIGETIKEGELLLELEVPDLEADLDARLEQVKLKDREVNSAKALLAGKIAGLEAAQAKVNQAKASIVQAVATREFRKKRLERYQTLAKDDTVTTDLVDEQTKEFEAAAAAVDLATATLSQANGSLAEKDAEIQAAKADVEQKISAVQVALKDVEKARAQLGLAKIVAPFDGVVVYRTVDPGDFSYAPSGGSSKTAMLVVASDKRAKVEARFPDSILVGLSGKSRAEIAFDNLPGVYLRGQISRFAPMVDASDRAVLVELDLDLRPANSKPEWPGSISVSPEQASRLRLGMTGTMKIELENLGNAAVIPSGALFSKGGKPQLYLVEGGVARLFSAVVQLDDGRSAVVQISTKAGPHRHLTPNDLVVLNRQTELQDGMEVSPAEVKP